MCNVDRKRFVIVTSHLRSKFVNRSPGVLTGKDLRIPTANTCRLFVMCLSQKLKNKPTKFVAVRLEMH